MITRIAYLGRRTCHCPIKNDPYFGSGKMLKQAIAKYGKENFEKIVLLECESKEELIAKEEALLQEFNVAKNKFFYNIVYCGESKDKIILTNEEVKKMNFLKKEIKKGIANDSDKPAYYMKLNDGKIDKKNPSITVAKITTTEDGGKKCKYITVFDNSKPGNLDKIIGSGFQSKETNMDDPYTVDKWFTSHQFIEIPKEIYDEYSEKYEAYNKIILSSFDELWKYKEKYTRNTNVKDTHSKDTNIKTKDDNVDAINRIREKAKTSNDYNNLKNLIDFYLDNGFRFLEIYYAATGRGSFQQGYFDNLKFSNKQYAKASEILDYELGLIDIANKINGRRDFFLMAVAFCYNLNGINHKSLLNRLRNKYKNISRISSFQQAINEIDRIYNYRRPYNERIHIKEEYSKSKK